MVLIKSRTKWSIAQAGDILAGSLKMTAYFHSQRSRHDVPLLTYQRSQTRLISIVSKPGKVVVVVVVIVIVVVSENDSILSFSEKPPVCPPFDISEVPN